MRNYLLFLSIISLFYLDAAEGFQTFTGQVVGDRVRMRTAPNLDGTIIKELNKGEILLVVGEKENYYAVAPKDSKVYIFKSYVMDGVVEADRVNIRLKPDRESPILGQAKKNQTVNGEPSSKNPKWFEITPPDNIFFYVAKEYIKKAGDKSFYSLMNKRKEEVDKLLNSAFFLAQAECKKPYLEMDPKNAISQFEAVIKLYSGFKEHVKQAKEGLALLQDTYLQKKIAHLETRANIDPSEKKQVLDQVSSFEKKLIRKKPQSFEKGIGGLTKKLTKMMKEWIPQEKELFSTWTTYNPDKTIEEFYNEQKANGIYLTGTIKSYNQPVKNKPGNYILKGDTIPIAYLYSTIIDLEDYVGKKATILISPRPNNNFAFPAYFVNEIKADKQLGKIEKATK